MYRAGGSAVGEQASWDHRVAALDRPDEGLAAQLEGLAADEAARGRLPLAATHLQWASDVSPARADRERRLLTWSQGTWTDYGAELARQRLPDLSAVHHHR
jgi:hypothetical protein